MSQTKYPMPSYVRAAVVCHCRGYKETRDWYDEAVQQIDSVHTELDGQPHGKRRSDPTARKALTRAELDASPRARIMMAIEQAVVCIGNDLDNEKLRADLREAIWESTLQSRMYPYEVWDLPAISRKAFYERKRQFIFMAALNAGLIK